MKPVSISGKARLDLDEIWSYIAKDNMEQANKVLAEIEANFQKLAEWPRMGQFRKDIKDPRYRFWRVYSYIIVYLPDAKPLEIARVISGYRNLRKII